MCPAKHVGVEAAPARGTPCGLHSEPVIPCVQVCSGTAPSSSSNTARTGSSSGMCGVYSLVQCVTRVVQQSLQSLPPQLSHFREIVARSQSPFNHLRYGNIENTDMSITVAIFLLRLIPCTLTNILTTHQYARLVYDQVARTAYAKAQQALGGRGNVAVYNSLDAWMQLSTCPNVSRSPDAPRRRPVFHADPSQAPPSAHVFYVSPTTGDDANPGTDEAKPLKTLHRAQAMVRALSTSDRPGTIVNLLEGTYNLGSPDSPGTLVFTPADGGALGRPVTWQAHPPGARVVVSGGMQLDCK